MKPSADSNCMQQGFLMRAWSLVTSGRREFEVTAPPFVAGIRRNTTKRTTYSSEGEAC